MQTPKDQPNILHCSCFRYYRFQKKSVMCVDPINVKQAVSLKRMRGQRTFTIIRKKVAYKGSELMEVFFLLTFMRNKQALTTNDLTAKKAMIQKT